VLAWGESIGGPLFAGTEAGLFLTGDSGRSWKSAALPSEPRYVFDVATGPGDACYAATENGLATSQDQGRSWTEQDFIYGLRNVLVTADAGVTVAHRNGLFRAAGAGAEFEKQEVTGAETLIIHNWDHPVELPDRSLVVADADGVLRLIPTEEPGRWRVAARALAHTDVRDLVVLADGRLLAATDNGVFASGDAAATWTQVSLP
jgi:photosystem II stability/assembly factor-like uncharacterized protein